MHSISHFFHIVHLADNFELVDRTADGVFDLTVIDYSECGTPVALMRRKSLSLV